MLCNSNRVVVTCLLWNCTTMSVSKRSNLLQWIAHKNYLPSRFLKNLSWIKGGEASMLLKGNNTKKPASSLMNGEKRWEAVMYLKSTIKFVVRGHLEQYWTGIRRPRFWLPSPWTGLGSQERHSPPTPLSSPIYEKSRRDELNVHPENPRTMI